MRFKTLAAIVSFMSALGACAIAGGQTQGVSTAREDLYHLTLDDGAVLVIHSSTGLSEREPKKDAPVRVFLYPKGSTKLKQPATWGAALTRVDYAPESGSYYALVDATTDRVFVFCTWNEQHFTIDRRTGRMLEQGTGDDALKERGGLSPLKLWITFGPPSSGKTGNVWRTDR